MEQKIREAIRDGGSFAESNMRVLIKMHNKGLLKQIVGIECIPQDDLAINTYVEEIAVPAAVRTFSRDEKYVGDSFSDSLNAFTLAFSTKLKELLKKATGSNETQAD